MTCPSAMRRFREFLTELAHLADLGKRDADLERLLSLPLSINIKVDQASFVVMRDGDRLRYFGRGGTDEITKVKRVGLNLYEAAIQHVERQDWRRLPDQVRVFLELFDDSLPSIARYSTAPPSKMMLSYCQAGSTIIGPADPLCQVVAEILNVEPPPMIFNGTLSVEQRQRLLDYVRQPAGDLISLVRELFSVPAELEFLMVENFEGLVLYLSYDRVPMAKLVDPRFTRAIKQKAEVKSPWFDALMDAVFDNAELVASAIDQLRPRGASAEDRYIDAIERLTLAIYQQLKRDIDDRLSSLENEPGGRVNVAALSPELRAAIDDRAWVEPLFSALLFTLRKERSASMVKLVPMKRVETLNAWVKRVREKVEAT